MSQILHHYRSLTIRCSMSFPGHSLRGYFLQHYGSFTIRYSTSYPGTIWEGIISLWRSNRCILKLGCVPAYFYICVTKPHKLKRFNFIFQTHFVSCPVCWSCRIHWLHLCWGVRPPAQWVSWVWHKTVWWWGPSNAGALGNKEHPFIAIAPRSTLARRGSTW